MPFLFYIYGKRIRAKSKFSPAPDIAQDKRRDEEAVVWETGSVPPSPGHAVVDVGGGGYQE